MPKSSPSSNSHSRPSPVPDTRSQPKRTVSNTSASATTVRPILSTTYPTRCSTSSKSTSSRNQEQPLLTRKQYSQAINNDIRGIFPDLKLSEKGWQRLERRMRSPYDLSAGVPTEKQLLSSATGEYYFGFYMRDSDIREFSVKYNPERVQVSITSLEDMNFLVQALSLMMDGWRKVILHRGIISEWHKKNVRGVVEDVKDHGYVVVLLSSDEYDEGCNPTNREIYELRLALRRKPCWFEAYD